MVIQPQNAERLVRLLVWVGGAGTTAVGALFASKIRVYHDHRNAHHEDLKKKILEPVRGGLLQYFQPMAANQVAVLKVEHGPREFNEKAKVTENPMEYGVILVAPFPTALILGPLDSALLIDAQKTHYVNVMHCVDEFLSAWSQFAGDCHHWGSNLAREILARSGMPAFPNPDQNTRCYVMHLYLAVYIYKRLFRLPIGAVHLTPQGMDWTMDADDRTVALGSKVQLDALVGVLDKFVESEASVAQELRKRAGKLHRDLAWLILAFDEAISSRRLRKKCDLVPFF